MVLVSIDSVKEILVAIIVQPVHRRNLPKLELEPHVLRRPVIELRSREIQSAEIICITKRAVRRMHQTDVRLEVEHVGEFIHQTIRVHAQRKTLSAKTRITQRKAVVHRELAEIQQGKPRVRNAGFQERFAHRWNSIYPRFELSKRGETSDDAHNA